MRQRIRAWFSDASLGLVISVGVVIGFAVWQILITTVDSFVMPILYRWENGGVSSSRLTFHLGHYKFDYTFFTAYVIAFFLLCSLIYFVFIAGDGTSEGEGFETRDCPECKNEIWADATRCSFCTAVVEPLAPPEQAADPTA